MGNTCCTKEPEKTKFSSYEENEILTTSKMRTPQSIRRVVNEEYLRIVPRITYYLKKKNISAIFKHKCPLFAAGGWDRRIYLFSNSLEHMGTFVGKKGPIDSLCAISNKILASGSRDTYIKIWDIEERIIITTLSGHTRRVSALCHLEGRQLVSGSEDNSLIIWNKLSGSSSTYSQRQLIGHISSIKGIIKISKAEIISGENGGDLRIWNIDQGVCIRHIPYFGDYGGFLQMKQNLGGEVALNYNENVLVWGAVNNWEAPIKQFRVCNGCSIEFLDRDILLIGRYDGQFEFVDYAQTGCLMPPDIQGLHSNYIEVIQRLAKNMLVTASYDRFLKVIDPISRKCYLNFSKGYRHMRAIAYFY